MHFSSRKPIASAAVLALVSAGLVTAPERASAGNDFLKGVIVGGVGAAIINHANKNQRKSAPRTVYKKKTVTKKSSSGPRSTIATFATTRTEVRDYQTRLNALGYNAGTPDGLYGKMTRNAVSSFQASLGAPMTGKLTSSEAGILIQRSSQPLIATAGPSAGYAMAAQQPQAYPQPQTAFQQSQPQTGYPAPAAVPFGQQAAGASPAFPAMPAGTAPQAASQPTAAPHNAFPTLGTGTQQPAVAAPGFPQAPQPQGQMAAATPQGGAFPTMPSAAAPQSATTQAAAPQPAFPSISTASAATPKTEGSVAPTFGAAQSSFPSLQTAAVAVAAGATSAAQAVGFKPTVQMPKGAAAPAAAPEAERFSILDVSTGSSLSEAKQQLAFEGLTNCEEVSGVTHCSAGSDAMQDLVAVKTEEMPDGEIKVGAMSRHLTFTQPMPQDSLREMMADRYAALLDAPNQMIGSSDCMSLANLTSGGKAELTARIMSGDNASLASLAKSCGHFSRIVFGSADDNDLVNEVSIFLFDGSIFADGVEAAKPAKIKF